MPSPETLNLLFGILAASLINVVTSLALGAVPDHLTTQARGVGAGLGLATLGVGSLAVVASRCKEEAILSGAGGLTSAELKWQVRQELAQRTAWISLGLGASIAGLLLAVCFALLASPIAPPQVPASSPGGGGTVAPSGSTAPHRG